MKRRIIGTSIFKNGFTKDRFLVLFSVLLCIGLMVGAILIGLAKQNGQTELIDICSRNFDSKISNSLIYNFFNAFISSLFSVFPFYVLGICAVGFPFLCILPFFFGVGIGVKIGFLYITFGLKKIHLSIFLQIPQTLIFVLILFFLYNISIKASKQVYSTINPQKNQADFTFKRYNKCYLFILSAIVFYSLIDSLIFNFGIRFF